MKTTLSGISLIFVILLFSCRISAQENLVPTRSSEEATIIATNHISQYTTGKYELSTPKQLIDEQSGLIGWVIELLPQGYIVVPASSILPEVIAYSFQSSLEEPGDTNPLIRMLKIDIPRRVQYYTSMSLSNSSSVSNIGNSDLDKHLFEQWPASGDGWLTTNWTQTAPYNNLCPMDLISQSRSYAGCPSVAMAMILNYHKNTNNTHFDDSDDYYHNYAGRQYHIDDDYETVDFASFPQLNEYLDTLNSHWQQSKPLTANDKAALTFACGLACKQVYTAEGSGTFGVDQALEAYLRFGCNTAELLDDSDTDLWTRVQQNIKDTLPAHFAIVDEAWQSGHNVVIDGYNTDDYYHINFGWGGSNNGWYLLPEEMPYNLTVVEGIVVDIMKDTTVNTVNHQLSTCKVYPNPSSEVTRLVFDNPLGLEHSITIYNSLGQVSETIQGIKGCEVVITNKYRNSGPYFFVLENYKGVVATGKFLVNQ